MSDTASTSPTASGSAVSGGAGTGTGSSGSGNGNGDSGGSGGNGGNDNGSGSGKLDYVRAHHSEDVVEKMNKATVTGETVAGVSSAASVVFGSSAGSALRLTVVGQLCKLGQPMEERTYPLLLHPTQWVLFGSQAAGVVVGNFLITISFWLLMCIVVQVVSCLPMFKALDAVGLCRFPSSPLFVFQFLLQGTALGAMALVFYPPSTPLFLLGAASLMFCCVVPFYVLYSVCNGVPRKAYYLHDVDVDRKTWLSALIGPGEWVSRFETNMWSYRYAAVVRPYRQEWACYSFVEMAASLTVAAVDSTTAHSLVACGHQKTGSAVVFIVLLVAEIYAWPHARARDGYMFPTIQLVQASALLLMAVGYYVENTDYWTFGTAAELFMVCAAIFGVKVVLDLGTEVYLYCKGRRTTLQEYAYAESAKTLLECDTESVLDRESLSVSSHGSLFKDTRHNSTLAPATPSQYSVLSSTGSGSSFATYSYFPPLDGSPRSMARGSILKTHSNLSSVPSSSWGGGGPSCVLPEGRRRQTSMVKTIS